MHRLNKVIQFILPRLPAVSKQERKEMERLDGKLRLRSLRETHGISQRDLAASLGVTPGAVAKWELCFTVPTVENLLALADLFGCPLDAIFGREPPGRTSA